MLSQLRAEGGFPNLKGRAMPIKGHSDDQNIFFIVNPTNQDAHP
jgi:hypothetical protein